MPGKLTIDVKVSQFLVRFNHSEFAFYVLQLAGSGKVIGSFTQPLSYSNAKKLRAKGLKVIRVDKAH